MKSHSDFPLTKDALPRVWMCKARWSHLYSILLNAVGLIGLLLFVGCTKNTTSISEPSKPLTEVLPTPSQGPTPTSVPQAGVTAGAPHVSPFVEVTVVDVEIRFLETNPVQIELVIRGVLPDQCKYRFYSVENRADQNVTITLDGRHPADTTCSQTAQNIEYVLLLGRDMPEAERGFSPGDYMLTVNNYQTSFPIK